jgi:hypothetical protein
MTDEELVEAFGKAMKKLGADPVVDGPGYNIERKIALGARATLLKNMLLVRMEDLRAGRTPRKKPSRMAVVGRKSRK